MRELELTRQLYQSPDFKKLDFMREELEELILSGAGPEDGDWKELIQEIIRFQDTDGSFSLVDSFHIESDCRVFYCYEPTYICTALLMKALLADPEVLTGKEDIILQKAMTVCCGRGLKGHGFDWLNDMIRAIDYFIAADVKEFLKKYPDLCPEFTDMFREITEFFATRVEKEAFTGDFGEDYEQDIRRIHHYLSGNLIFVYGTLMRGKSNHDSFLGDSCFLGNGKIDGYEMYDLGSFPGIIKGEGKVSGEVYAVTDAELKAIDRLEGEGSLYRKVRTEVRMEDGDLLAADAYVYLHSVENAKRICGKYGDGEYVWYVSYGSNLLEERLKYYIQGGDCRYNGTVYSSCSDTALPVESRPVLIPYNMYYGNYGRGSWKNSAVSFLDLSRKGMAYGRAYKVKKTQLDGIHRQEGKGASWYPECIRLQDIDGLEAYTFAGHQEKKKEPFSRVSAEYGIVLYRGLKECYPGMSEREIWDYLKGAGEQE